MKNNSANISDDVVINSLKVSRGEDIIFLLGAGCSVNSGCMPSSKLIYEFKKRIFCAKHGIQLNGNLIIDDIRMKEAIEREMKNDSDTSDYSYFFEKCFPDSLDRNQFIKDEFHNKKPSLGYLCFAKYLIENNVRYVLTTNFDLLLEKAIKKIDENYDLVNLSEGEKPCLSAKLEIIKLHGDYNYSLIKNTSAELKALDNDLLSILLAIKTKKIFVVGYSGADSSVMSFLNLYLRNNPSTTLYWCGIEGECHNDEINELISLNQGSSYKCISGFDSLFEKYYRTYGIKNEVIDNMDDANESNRFELICTNQPEHFRSNAYKISRPAVIYKTKDAIPERVLDQLYFYTKRGDITYFIDSKTVADDLSKRGIGYSLCDVCAENINIIQKCKIIKELIKFVSRENGVSVFRDNLYIDTVSNTIKEGIKITVDLIGGDICLILVPNYFVASDEIDEKQKGEINYKKSSLYPKQNLILLENIIDKLFKKSLNFINGEIGVSFFDVPKDFEELKSSYECIKEPLMVGDRIQSVNQLRIINSAGPKETLFSIDEIKVGIFCVEEDKAKLRSFLKLVEYGDSGSGSGIIPRYKGFFNTFKKKITFIYDALPVFIARMFSGKSLDEVASGFMRGIARMYSEKQIDIALLYIGNNLSWIREQGEFDFHNKIKLLSANKFKTQFLEEKTIDSTDNRSKILFNFATGIYTKTVGMPWYPLNYSKDTLFLGISFGRDSNGITVGCSQMFDGAGRGMQLIISKISEKKDRRNQYLSEEEAFELGKKIRQTYYRSSKTEDLNRIVIHRSDPFRKEEILGFKKAFAGINDFALVQIIEDTSLNLYPFTENRCGAYPVKRGTMIKTSNDTVYLWTNGSVVDPDIDNGRTTYRNSKRGMGRPLKIKKYYGNISANDVASDLMYLTKMDFNSSDVLYSKLPVTIKYSRIVCEIIKQGNFEDELISFEYVM